MSLYGPPPAVPGRGEEPGSRIRKQAKHHPGLPDPAAIRCMLSPTLFEPSSSHALMPAPETACLSVCRMPSQTELERERSSPLAPSMPHPCPFIIPLFTSPGGMILSEDDKPPSSARLAAASEFRREEPPP